MPRLTRKPEAERDLVEIWLYIAKDNPGAADRVIDRIEEICNLLARNPNFGPARDDIALGLRHCVVGRYLVLYRKTTYGADVIRIVHGARDLPSLF